MKIGIIGGSGLYEIDGITDLQEHAIDTPFGAPSDIIMGGRLGDNEVFFLPRHGRGHRLLPGEINHRANIFGRFAPEKTTRTVLETTGTTRTF